jgi:hypothetical protein
MVRALSVALLILASCAVGCETGSQQENVTTTGAAGQKVGANSNREGGPVPGSTTGLPNEAAGQGKQGAQAAPASGEAPPPSH